MSRAMRGRFASVQATMLSVKLRAAVLNLFDTTYFDWPNVRGRQATDPAIDRYSSPGINATVSLSYGW